MVSRLSFQQIFHLKFSIVRLFGAGEASRVACLVLSAGWLEPGRIFKVLSPSPSGHNVTATGRAGVTGQMALACKCGPAKPSEAALIR